MSEYTVPYYVHNDFLQIAAEIGLLGILFFLYFIFNPFLLLMKKIYSSKENLVDLMIFLIDFSVHNRLIIKLSNK